MANDRIFLVHTRSRKAVCLGCFSSIDGQGNIGWSVKDENIFDNLDRFYSQFDMYIGDWKKSKYHGDPRMFHLEYEEASLDLSGSE